MTNPIDLNLVELRCKLRGWKCVRFVEDGVDYVSVECRYGGELILGADGWVGRESGWDTPEHKRIEALLTAPRWTLERLLSEPPEGWVYDEDHEELVWRGDCDLSVSWADDGEGGLDFEFELDGDCPQSCLPAFARQLKAAAELALILAEVEP